MGGLVRRMPSAENRCIAQLRLTAEGESRSRTGRLKLLNQGYAVALRSVVGCQDQVFLALGEEWAWLKSDRQRHRRSQTPRL
jgi:hypothetical protein